VCCGRKGRNRVREGSVGLRLRGRGEKGVGQRIISTEACRRTIMIKRK
jgi:hypothetical protein